VEYYYGHPFSDFGVKGLVLKQVRVQLKVKGPLLAREKVLKSGSVLAQGKASLLTKWVADQLADRLADQLAGRD